MIALALFCCVTLMNDWYDGPLSERMIDLEERRWHSWRFNGYGPDRDGIRRVSERLEHAPIFVLAPGNPYAGYGLQSSYDGRIYLVEFNWLIGQAIEQTGAEDIESSPGIVPPPHESLAWALAALRSMGVEPDIDWQPGFPEHSRTWEGQLAHDAADPTPYNPSAVRFVLEDLGVDLPADLACVPRLPPPPPPPPPEPPLDRAAVNAKIRALLIENGLPIPPEYAEP